MRARTRIALVCLGALALWYARQSRKPRQRRPPVSEAVPLPVMRLNVSEIRQRIFQASGRGEPGEGSLAGQLFHRVADCAIRKDHPAGWQQSLTATLDRERWAQSLYDEVLGPDLTRLQSSLRESGEAVLAVWTSVERFTRWFCGLLEEAIAAGALRYDGQRECWEGGETLFQPECDLAATLHDPSWTVAVQIAGRADQLIRVAENRWCVVEFKLGGGHAESDAAQACLYHELLGGGAQTAALVRFTGQPEPEQTVLAGEWIQEARPKLMALIGAMTGDAPAPAIGETAWPKPASEAEISIGKRLLRALQEYKSEAGLVGEPLVGPTFVRYLLDPGRGVFTRKIEKQAANLQTRLQLEHEPMIGRSGGRISVDIQRPVREFVSFDSLRAAIQPIDAGLAEQAGSAKVLVGVDLIGKVHFLDLARDVPHLLVGGIPGGGKSEWLRAALASLLIANTPETVRLVLIDPKKNAFTELEGSPFLWRPNAFIDSPEGRVIPLLEDVMEEIMRRAELFKQFRADNLDRFKAKTGEALPRIICVVDEFADLLMSGKKSERDEIERGFIRIAQMGRAAGVHLILATQRPSKQVVSGMLKANIPGKIALRVNSHVESLVLLDHVGAQHLLGKGDLLLSAGGFESVRLQAAYLSEEERQEIFGKRS